jgi:hypothetical protein
MDVTQLLNGIVQNLIAGFPELVVVVTTVTYGLKSIKSRTAQFPDLLQATKLELTKGYDSTKDKMFGIMSQTLDQVQKEMKQSLIDMAGNLANYERELVANKEQSNIMVQQNKLYMDIITELINADPEKVQSGISIVLNNHMKTLRQTLEENPEALVNDLNVVVESLAQTAKVIGQEKFDALIGKFGYERKEI